MLGIIELVRVTEMYVYKRVLKIYIVVWGGRRGESISIDISLLC